MTEHPPTQPGDNNLIAIRTRRIVLETVLSEAVALEPNIHVRVGEPAESLLFDTSGEIPHVTGARTASGVYPADLVIDAAGRHSPIGSWLAEAGSRSPVVESHSVGRAYFSRWYRLRPDSPKSPGRVWDVAVTPFAINLVFPSDNDIFAVTFAVPVSDPARLALRDPAVFDAAARRFPASGAWLALEPEGLGEVRVMAGLDNRWCALVDSTGPIVTGLVGVGDSITHTNPTLGQGVALTLLAAQRVATTIDDVTAPETYAVDYHDWTVRTLKPWFDHQVAVDSGDQILFARARDASAEPLPPPSIDDTTRIQYAATPCAMVDPVVMRARAQVRHLALTPDLAYAVEEVRERLACWLKEHAGAGMPQFLTRTEWEALLGVKEGAIA